MKQIYRIYLCVLLTVQAQILISVSDKERN